MDCRRRLSSSTISGVVVPPANMNHGFILVHGGNWKNNVYDGGLQEYVPQNQGSISYAMLLQKVKQHVKINTNIYFHQIEALVQPPIGEKMRMKITDDDELSYLFGVIDTPVLYITICLIDGNNLDTSSGLRNRHILPSMDSVGVNVGGDDDILHDEHEHGQKWVVPGALYHASIPCPDLLGSNDYSRDAICKDATFLGKEKMVTALGLYHLANRVKYSVDRSSKSRFYAICKFDEHCSFRMRASAEGIVWTINEWNAPHTCQLDLSKHNNPTVRSNVVAAYFAPKLLNEGAILRPKDIVHQFLREYGIDVDYQLALSGRNKAMTKVYGDAEKSFQLLPSYLYMVQRCNPGSVVDLETDEDQGFKYIFMAFGASVRAFGSCCRPVIVVDATHLKGSYRGVMFVAITLDGNEQLFPLAVGIGDTENDLSWTWFFRRIQRAFGRPDQLLFISDQHQSIRNAIKTVYPDTPHGFCTYHLQGNLKIWKKAIPAYERALYCYRSTDFDKHMETLAGVSKSARKKLIKIGPHRWARSKCEVRRYNFLTSNAAECFNSRIRWARRLPVTTLLEAVRTILSTWFQERREIYNARSHALANFAQNRLEQSTTESYTMVVEAISRTKFNVKTSTNNYLVDLASRKCACCEFQLDLMPCSHAVAAIRTAKESVLSYVSDYYTIATLRETYAEEVIPTPHPTEWCVPSEISGRTVRTPSDPKQAGRRPRLKRIKKKNHSSAKNRLSAKNDSSASSRLPVCTRCHQPGHNRATCRQFVQTIETEDVSNQQPPTKKIRRTKHCSLCHEAGHTRLTCRLRVDLDSDDE